MTFVPTAKDFEMQYDSEHTFSFFEGEEGDFFSFGHRDVEELVAEVKEYLSITDPVFGLTDEEYAELAGTVKHTWGVVTSGTVDDEWYFRYADKYINDPKGFPVTVLGR